MWKILKKKIFFGLVIFWGKFVKFISSNNLDYDSLKNNHNNKKMNIDWMHLDYIVVCHPICLSKNVFRVLPVFIVAVQEIVLLKQLFFFHVL